MATFKEIEDTIKASALTTDEINALDRVLAEKFKQVSLAAKAALRVGDEVSFYHEDHCCTYKGVVTKINRKNVHVDVTSREWNARGKRQTQQYSKDLFPVGNEWNVSPHVLKKI